MMSHFYKMCTVSQISFLFAHTLIVSTFSTVAYCKLLKCKNTTDHIGLAVILLDLSLGGAKFEYRPRPAILTAFSWCSLVLFGPSRQIPGWYHSHFKILLDSSFVNQPTIQC